MIVAFMNPLVGAKANGNTIPKAIRVSASARLHQGGTRFWIASRHSVNWAISSLIGQSRFVSSGLPRLLPEQPARSQHHHQDQVAEHNSRGPLRSEARVRELLDAPDDQPAEHGAANVPDPAHDRRGERDQSGFEALEVPDRRLV